MIKIQKIYRYKLIMEAFQFIANDYPLNNDILNLTSANIHKTNLKKYNFILYVQLETLFRWGKEDYSFKYRDGDLKMLIHQQVLNDSDWIIKYYHMSHFNYYHRCTFSHDESIRWGKLTNKKFIEYYVEKYNH